MGVWFSPPTFFLLITIGRFVWFLHFPILDKIAKIGKYLKEVFRRAEAWLFYVENSHEGF